MLHIRLVINEQDLLQQMFRRPVDDGVHCADEGGPGLVVEADHHGGGLQVGAVGVVGSAAPVAAPVGERSVKGKFLFCTLLALFRLNF